MQPYSSRLSYKDSARVLRQKLSDSCDTVGSIIARSKKSEKNMEERKTYCSESPEDAPRPMPQLRESSRSIEARRLGRPQEKLEKMEDASDAAGRSAATTAVDALHASTGRAPALSPSDLYVARYKFSFFSMEDSLSDGRTVGLRYRRRLSQQHSFFNRPSTKK